MNLEASPSNGSDHGTILVVDDEELVCSVLTDMLTAQGYAVRTATNGRSAIDVFHRYSRDITAVILDMTMPGIDGEATLTELRCIDPRVKVVLMSGFIGHTTAQRLVSQGLASFLEKPFVPASLRQTLRGLRPAA
jgi:DNA-binding NtrC family response regulator